MDQNRWNQEFKEASENSVFKHLQKKKAQEKKAKFAAILKASRPSATEGFAKYSGSQVTFQTQGS